MLVAVMYSFSIIPCRQRYIPLVSRCCQRGGEARLSRRAHNPQSGFHFCKIAGGRKFKSTPRYYFFQTGILSFQCRTFVTALFFFLMIRPPPRSTLFPYTTLAAVSRA